MGCAAGGRSRRQVTVGAWDPPCITRRSTCLLQCGCLQESCLLHRFCLRCAAERLRRLPAMLAETPLVRRMSETLASLSGGSFSKASAVPLMLPVRRGRSCTGVAEYPAVAALTVLLPSQLHSALSRP